MKSRGREPAPPTAALEEIIARGALEWQQTFDAIASPVMVLDGGGVVRRLNRAARDLAGVPFPRAVGARAIDLGEGEPWAETARLAERALAERAVVHGQARAGDAGRVWDLEASFLAAGDGGADRVIVVLRDLTKLVELQESLRRSETLSALGALLAAVAHEVRNPLFGITATLDAMHARFGGEPALERHFGVLRAELQRLKALMSDLLEFGRPVEPDRRCEPTEGLLEEAARLSRLLAAERQVRIVARDADGAGEAGLDPARARARIDRSRIIRLLLNLIENAIFHSPGGGVVEVVRRCAPDGAGGGAVLEVEVLDQGPGFAPGDLPRIFEPFFSRRSEGIGLGLAIAERIAREHGARLEAGNRPAGGAWVRLQLPVEIDPRPARGEDGA